MMLSYEEKIILTKHYAPMIFLFLKQKNRRNNSRLLMEVKKYLRDFQVLYIQRKMKNLKYEFPNNINNELLKKHEVFLMMEHLYQF